MTFSVTQVLQEVVGGLAPLAQRKSVEISVEFDSAIPELISTDPLRFRQILNNLVGNAIKFTENGRITLCVGYRDNAESAHLLLIDIKDTGIGIAPEDQKKLFEPFVQADSSVSRRFGGTGLGLNLAKRLADALGGSLNLKSSVPGKGSCYSLTIDCGEVSATPFVTSLNTSGLKRDGHGVQSVPVKEGAQLAGVRVLLAEDSPDNAVLFRLYLQVEGAVIDHAQDGLEAIEKAEKNEYNVVLMDLQMPKLGGLEATRRLRARKYDKPIIALTAHALREEIVRSMDAGCDCHISKPVNRDDLIKSIQSQLAKKLRP